MRDGVMMPMQNDKNGRSYSRRNGRKCEFKLCGDILHWLTIGTYSICQKNAVDYLGRTFSDLDIWMAAEDFAFIRRGDQCRLLFTVWGQK